MRTFSCTASVSCGVFSSRLRASYSWVFCCFKSSQACFKYAFPVARPCFFFDARQLGLVCIAVCFKGNNLVAQTLDFFFELACRAVESQRQWRYARLSVFLRSSSRFSIRRAAFPGVFKPADRSLDEQQQLRRVLGQQRFPGLLRSTPWKAIRCGW